MATTGWLGEQTVHEWGGWGTRFTTNVYISGIRRYSDHVDVSGTIYLYCKSNGAYSVWYDWNITSWSMGNNLGQIKERTYTNNILNRSWGKNFTVRINCSNSATSATFNAGFSDSNMGGRDKYWTIYFDRYATAPSGITSTSSYTEYSTITTSCSGIKWGQGYSNRKLTCTVSYTFNGKTENFTLGTWTDGATSKTVTKSDFNFPADLNVSIKWVASTNVGSTTSTSQVRVGQTYPAPNLSEVNFEGSSPSTYKLNATVTGINYGENYSKREANLYFDYTLDGISYSTLLSSISDGSTSITVEYDATTETEPWKFIPDDEKGILRLVVDNGHRTSTKSSAQIYCQPQYEAYIVESIPDSEKEKSEIYTGKNIQIQNAPKDAPLADFKLYGDTFQKTYEGKNLFDDSVAPINDSLTPAGVSWSVENDGSMHTNGTNSRQYRFIRYEVTLPAGSYWFGGCPSGGSTDGYSMVIQTDYSDPSTMFFDTGSGNTFTLAQQATIQVFPIRIGSQTVNMDGKVFKPIIVAGSTASTYEPYVGGQPSPNPDYPQPIQAVAGEQTITINGTEYQLDLGTIELCKLGDYQDYIWKDGEDWKVHKATKSARFGSFSWVTKDTGGSGVYRQEAEDIKTEVVIPATNTTFIGCCSDYRNVTAGQTYAASARTGVAIQYAGYQTSGNVCVYDPLYDAPNQADNFKAARASSVIYYALVTPTDTTITDQTLIEQLESIRKASLQNGINNIMNIAIAPNLTGDMEISYYTKWQDTFPATLYSNGKNGTGQFKQIRRIGTK